MLILTERLKLEIMLRSYIFCTCVWFGGWFGTLETSSKALILSKSPKYGKLDSLAYYYGMRVFAYMGKIWASQTLSEWRNERIIHFLFYTSHYSPTAAVMMFFGCWFLQKLSFFNNKYLSKKTHFHVLTVKREILF